MDGRSVRVARLAPASSGRENAVRGASLLAAVFLGVGLVAFFGSAPTEAREYSAYSDPGKTALSFVFSDEGNAEAFREAFGMDAAEVEKVLVAVRQENEALAREYAESERLVESGGSLSEEGIGRKIDASDYDERVRAAIAETKRVAESVVPEGRRSDLQAWVDARWLEEAEEAREEPQMVQARAVTSRARRGITCEVFATQYEGYTNFEVALPHEGLKFRGGFKVRIRRASGANPTRAPVREVGPWNTRDNYWASRANRDRWRSLPRCKPEAEAAYYDNFNRGEDQYGREVLNPAGVDLTPAVARRLGLGRYQNAWVRVHYPWVRR